MRHTIFKGEHPLTLEHDNFEAVINVDDLTKIDTSNLFGEAATISAAANRIGLLKAEVEKRLAETKLELKIFEAKFKSKLRRQASEEKGFYSIRVDNEDVKVKLTEKSLETAFEADPDWIEIKKKYITAEESSAKLGSLLWAVQDKARKLNTLTSGTTPEEFVAQIIEGKINGISLRK